MTLTLSSSHLSTFENDVNVSVATKSECFKFLSVIIKNLLDPQKASDPKYRQLRLMNTKIQRMTSHASILSFVQQTLGFVPTRDDKGEPILRIGEEMMIDTAALEAALDEVAAAQDRVHKFLPRTVSNCSTTSTASAASFTSTSSSSNDQPPITAKQKGRMLLEAAEKAEKEAAAKARKRTVDQIKADKHVRKHDVNWKPTVSAAAATAGNAMETFRDKFGEN